MQVFVNKLNTYVPIRKVDEMKTKFITEDNFNELLEAMRKIVNASETQEAYVDKLERQRAHLREACSRVSQILTQESPENWEYEIDCLEQALNKSDTIEVKK